jgi:hypothetical protein
MPRGDWLEKQFHYDEFEELDPDVSPRPAIKDWAHPQAVLRQLRRQLDPDDHRRLPGNWSKQVKKWKERQHALFLRLHQGLFLTLGVEEWKSFAPAIQLLADAPEFVSEVLAILASFAARLAENILREVDIDAVIFSEPIAGNHGSLISPAMYRDLVLASFHPIFDALDRYRVPQAIWRSYANPRALIAEVARSRFTAIWVCESPPQAVDYRQLRQEYGPTLGLIGGIDTDILYQGPQEIERAVAAVLPLVDQGRFIPLADGRVREDVPYENYVFYRKTLETSIMKKT